VVVSKVFWQSKWDNDDIPFHNKAIHPELIRFWPTLNLNKGAHVFVPLCGKSVDMLFLMAQGYKVSGVELSEKAIVQFFNENSLDFKQEGNVFFGQGITIFRADIFKFEINQAIDAIYDRAALVALPQKLRGPYVKQLYQCLKPQGLMLVKCISYDESLMEGPPFSVTEREATTLFSDFGKKMLVNQQENNLTEDDFLYQKGLRKTHGQLYLLEK
jgi:thiopurine S-methyltransferase